MPSLRRIWSGGLAGLPSAGVTAIAVALTAFRHRLATLLWGGNLGGFGPRSHIQSGVTIRYPGQVFVGENTKIARGTEITTERAESICRIGSGVIVGVGVHLDFSGNLDIGNNVVISDHSSIYTHSHGLNPKSVPVKTPLSIGTNAWIGTRAVIVEGVESIGAGSVVAAGAVVTRSVPAHVLVAGIPAKIIRAIE